MNEPIKLNEWQRILVGEVPTGFFIELLIRAIICYLILVCSMRMMGKRMSSQLSRNELAAMVSLAATIGVPLMAPDRGVLPAMIIALTVVSTQRIIARWAFRDQRFERISQGNVSILVCDGVVDVKEMEKTGLSQERLFAELRCNAILHLGEVERLYIEANGAFTLVKAKELSPGLSVLPIQDEAFVGECSFDEQHSVCGFCGLAPAQENKSSTCDNCGKQEWKPAMQI
ncbi:DUF421 domain-containing protein [Mucilaginibacter sp. 21P]|nr:DUF421 domain-containing protein [Mucilaginibacter sp. 21P]